MLEEKAKIDIYDPKVSEIKIIEDINYLGTRNNEKNKELINVKNNPYDAVADSHAIAILTEWDEFIDYDWKKYINP